MLTRHSALAFSAAVILASALASPAAAQDKPTLPPGQQAMMDAMMKAATPGPNHKMLASMVGDWTFVMRMWMDPSAPPTETTGTVTHRALMGGRYVQGEFKAAMMGMPFEGTSVTGYDNVSGQFVSTWHDNMSTGIMYMTGSYDPASRSFTYAAEVPDTMQPTTKVKVREVVRVVDDAQHVMEMYETRGGKELKTMEIVFKRAK
jgi:hypothetical protein